MKLYEISSNIAKIERLLGDDSTQEGLTLELEGLQVELTEKAEGIVCLIKNLEAEADAFALEAKRLKEESTKRLSRAEWLRNYLAAWLPKTKHTFGVHQVSFRKSEVCSQVNTDIPVPERFLKPQEPKIDVAGIKETLKAGGEVPGWAIETKDNLQIR